MEGERQKMGFATWTEAVTAAINRVERRKRVNGTIPPEEQAGDSSVPTAASWLVPVSEE